MFSLDLTNAQESSFEPIPAGKYTVVCDDAIIKSTKAGDGEYINCKFKVVGGDYDGRILFNMFNIKNPNEQAVKIGLGQLKTFMKCAGFTSFKLTDVGALCGAKALAVVSIQNDSYGEKNKINSFTMPTAKDPMPTPNNVPF